MTRQYGRTQACDTVKRDVQRRQPYPRTKRAGFTLIELLVAMVAGVLVASTTYFIGAASARHFHEQERVAFSQTALRTSMMQLERDLAAAGSFGVPSSTFAQSCLPPLPVPLQAVQLFEDGDVEGTASIPNAAENGVSADRVVVTGNFMTSDSYLAIGLNVTGTEIILNANTMGFRRSFGFPFDPDRFASVFRAGRMLHMEALNGDHFFVPIAGVNPATFSIQLETPLPVNGGCPLGQLSGATVAPLAQIEWLVRNAAGLPEGVVANLAPRDAAAAEAMGLSESYLVRQERRFDDNSVMIDSIRVVAENVADFNLTFFALQNLGGLRQRVLIDAGNFLLHAHNLISVEVRLSVHTPDQDPRFNFVPRAPGEPLTRFRANPALPGAARVRSLRQDVFLNNIGPARGI